MPRRRAARRRELVRDLAEIGREIGRAPPLPAQLYGVSPWHFYLQNLLLNFNVLLPCALAAPPLVGLSSILVTGRKRRVVTAQLGLVLLTSYVWIGFFSIIPHKEARSRRDLGAQRDVSSHS